MAFKIKVDIEAKRDIQSGIDWYNEQEKGLGKQFHKEVKVYLDKLRTFPYFQFRYDKIRCLPLSRFPFMIHFAISEEDELVTVLAIINTSKDPQSWVKK